MRIALITSTFPTLSETFVRDEVVCLLEAGHEVVVYCAAVGDDPRARGQLSAEQVQAITRTWSAEGLPTLRRLAFAARSIPKYLRHAPKSLWNVLDPRSGFRDAMNLRRLVRGAAFLPSPTFDVVHAHFGDVGVLAQQLRDIGVLRGPLVTTFHGYDVSMLVSKSGGGFYQRLFQAGDLFLPVSDVWRRRLIELGCPAERTQTHRLGVDTEKFAYRSGPRSLGSVRLISPARLVEKKGVEFGIRAVAALVEQRVDVIYEIVGDGPLRQQLQQLAEQLGVASVVRFHGAKSHAEVLEMLSAADILLYPSVTGSNGDQEGIPVTIMEAMSVGLPVVATLHSGIPELVEDGRSGILAQERDVAGLVVAIHELASNPERRQELGARGREIVGARYHASRQYRALVELFESLVRPERHRPSDISL